MVPGAEDENLEGFDWLHGGQVGCSARGWRSRCSLLHIQAFCPAMLRLCPRSYMTLSSFHWGHLEVLLSMG